MNEKNDLIEEAIDDMMRNLPPKCDYCDFFSGNREHGAGKRPAYCLNPKSKFFNKIVQEEGKCDVFTNEIW